MRFFNLMVLLAANAFAASKAKANDTIPPNLKIERYKEQLARVKQIINNNKDYNQKIAFLVDMKVKSGKCRFYVYNLATDEIVEQGLVAHGSGSETGIRGNLKFSNEFNSHCTSLGRYAVGKPYVGIFGKSYRLSGLDDTNSNALKRAIVLHSYSAVPQEETDFYIVDSHGCPMVNEIFFKKLAEIIDSSKTKIILDIFY